MIRVISAVDSSYAVLIGAVATVLGAFGSGYAFIKRHPTAQAGEYVKQQAAVLADSLAVYDQLKSSLAEARQERDAAKKERDYAKSERDAARAEREEARLEVTRLTVLVEGMRTQISILQKTIEQVRDR